MQLIKKNKTCVKMYLLPALLFTEFECSYSMAVFDHFYANFFLNLRKSFTDCVLYNIF